MREITVTIDEEGNVKIQTRGFKGGACVKETEDLVKAIGGPVLQEKKTPEFYQKEEVYERAKN